MKCTKWLPPEPGDFILIKISKEDMEYFKSAERKEYEKINRTLCEIEGVTDINNEDYVQVKLKEHKLQYILAFDEMIRVSKYSLGIRDY